MDTKTISRDAGENMKPNIMKSEPSHERPITNGDMGSDTVSKHMTDQKSENWTKYGFVYGTSNEKGPIKDRPKGPIRMSEKTQKPFNVLDADMGDDEFVSSMDEKYFKILFCPSFDDSGPNLDKMPHVADKAGEKVENPIGPEKDWSHKPMVVHECKRIQDNTASEPVPTRLTSPDENLNFAKNGKFEPQERKTANGFGKEHSNMAPKTQRLIEYYVKYGVTPSFLQIWLKTWDNFVSSEKIFFIDANCGINPENYDELQEKTKTSDEPPDMSKSVKNAGNPPHSSSASKIDKLPDVMDKFNQFKVQLFVEYYEKSEDTPSLLGIWREIWDNFVPSTDEKYFQRSKC